MFLINVGYPTAEEELQIAKVTTGSSVPELKKLIDGPEILRFQDVVRRMPVPDSESTVNITKAMSRAR